MKNMGAPDSVVTIASWCLDKIVNDDATCSEEFIEDLRSLTGHSAVEFENHLVWLCSGDVVLPDHMLPSNDTCRWPPSRKLQFMCGLCTTIENVFIKNSNGAKYIHLSVPDEVEAAEIDQSTINVPDDYLRRVCNSFNFNKMEECVLYCLAFLSELRIIRSHASHYLHANLAWLADAVHWQHVNTGSVDYGSDPDLDIARTLLPVVLFCSRDNMFSASWKNQVSKDHLLQVIEDPSTIDSSSLTTTHHHHHHHHHESNVFDGFSMTEVCMIECLRSIGHAMTQSVPTCTALIRRIFNIPSKTRDNDCIGASSSSSSSVSAAASGKVSAEFVSSAMLFMTRTTEEEELDTGCNPMDDDASFVMRNVLEVDHRSGSSTGFDWDVFIASVNAVQPKFQWADVIRALDRPGINNELLLDDHHFSHVRKFMQKCCPFPVHFILTTWNNVDSQLHVLQCMQKCGLLRMLSAEDQMSLVDISMLKGITHLDRESLGCWLSGNLLKRLINIGDTANESQFHVLVNVLLSQPIEKIPEVIAMGILQSTPTSWNRVKEAAFSKCLAKVLADNRCAKIVFNSAWQLSSHNSKNIRACLFEAIFDFYDSLKFSSDHFMMLAMLRIHDILSGLKITGSDHKGNHDRGMLTLLLRPNDLVSPHSFFSIDLAIASHHKSVVEFTHWLSDRLETSADKAFIQALLKFTVDKAGRLSRAGCRYGEQVALRGSNNKEAYHTLTQWAVQTIIDNLCRNSDYLEQADLRNLDAARKVIRGLNSNTQQPSQSSNKPSSQSPICSSPALNIGSYPAMVSGRRTTTAIFDTTSLPSARKIAAAQVGLSGGRISESVAEDALSTARSDYRHVTPSQHLEQSTQEPVSSSESHISEMGTCYVAGSHLAVKEAYVAGMSCWLTDESGSNSNRQPSSRSEAAKGWNSDVVITDLTKLKKRMYGRGGEMKLTTEQLIQKVKRLAESSDENYREVYKMFTASIIEDYRKLQTLAEDDFCTLSEVFSGYIECDMANGANANERACMMRMIAESLDTTVSDDQLELNVRFSVRVLDKVHSILWSMPEYSMRLVTCVHYNQLSSHTKGNIEFIVSSIIHSSASSTTPIPSSNYAIDHNDHRQIVCGDANHHGRIPTAVNHQQHQHQVRSSNNSVAEIVSPAAQSSGSSTVNVGIAAATAAAFMVASPTMMMMQTSFGQMNGTDRQLRQLGSFPLPVPLSVAITTSAPISSSYDQQQQQQQHMMQHASSYPMTTAVNYIASSGPVVDSGSVRMYGAGDGCRQDTFQIPPMPTSNNAHAFANMYSARDIPVSMQTEELQALQRATNSRSNPPIPPPTEVANQVAFIFNNLSVSNLVHHTQFLKNIMTVSKDGVELGHWQWLAHYVVTKRVPVEPNYQTLYMQFVDIISLPQFLDEITSETYFYVSALLASSSTVHGHMERQCLKNLGQWLGMLTLARNKPLLATEIDIKALICEAYYKGHMFLRFVLPFVAKVLESCNQSKVFRPPNPWLIGLLSILAELHTMSGMSSNFRLEVEVLLKNLKCTDLEITPTNILSDPDECKRIADAAPRLASADQDHQNVVMDVPRDRIQAADATSPNQTVQAGFFAIPSAAGGQVAGCLQQQVGLQSGSDNTGAPHVVHSSGTQADQYNSFPSPRFSLADVKHPLDPNVLPSMLEIKANIQLFNAYPQLRQYTAHVIEKTMNGVLPGLMERASKIAISTTESLLKKDFCMFGDEETVRYAAHNMVGNLVAGLILIGGREQFYRLMSTNLHNYFLHYHQQSLNSTSSVSRHMVASDEMCKEAATIIARDNIELCVCVMSKLSMVRSMQEMERRLAGIYELTTRNRSSNTLYTSNPSNLVRSDRLPESLRQNRDEETGEELIETYSEFARNVPGFVALQTPPFDLSSMETIHYLDRLINDFTSYLNLVSSEINSSCTSSCSFMQTADSEKSHDPYGGNEIMQFVCSSLSRTRDVYISARSGLVHGSGNVLEATTAIMISSCRLVLEVYNEDTVFRIIGYAGRFRELIFSLLKSMTESCILGPAWASKITTNAVIDCKEDYRHNILAINVLVKYRLLDMATLDKYLMKEIESDTWDGATVRFAVNLVRYCLFEATHTTHTQLSSVSTGQVAYNGQDLYNTVCALVRCSVVNEDLEDLAWSMVEQLRHNYDIDNIDTHTSRVLNPSRMTSGMAVLLTAVSQVKTDYIKMSVGDADLVDLQDKSLNLLREWMKSHQAITGSNLLHREAHRQFSNFILSMNSLGIFRCDDFITGFFRICLQACITHSYKVLSVKGHTEELGSVGDITGSNAMATSASDVHNQQSAMSCRGSMAALSYNLYPASGNSICFELCDAFVKLVVLLIKRSGDPRNQTVKISLLSKVLGLTAGCCLYDHEVKCHSFHPLPYQRFFHSLFNELSNDPSAEQIYHPMCQSFMAALFLLNPIIVPAFAFSWVELIGNGTFIGKVLSSQNQPKTHAMYSSMLASLLRFIAPFLDGEATTMKNQSWLGGMFKAILRIFLVLLHDFPEFLCEYAHMLVDRIPLRCIQLRNICLSAFSRSMKLPDPLNKAIRVDLLPEVGYSPDIKYNYVANIQPPHFKQALDNYLSTRAPVHFLTTVRKSLKTGNKYNIKVVNAVVLYVGVKAIESFSRGPQTISLDTVKHCAHMDVFETFAADLDCEGRYLFLNAVANHIRYPNSHTHYFSCVLLHLFDIVESEIIKEQVIRVLTERLIVNRPHPWGLLLTFVELVRNKSYGLMEYDFINEVPEIKRLFESAGQISMSVKQ